MRRALSDLVQPHHPIFGNAFCAPTRPDSSNARARRMLTDYINSPARLPAVEVALGNVGSIGALGEGGKVGHPSMMSARPD